MCDIEAFKLRIMQAVCYLCGHDDFSVEDMEEAQSGEMFNSDEIVNLLPYAVCPCCGFTIEI